MLLLPLLGAVTLTACLPRVPRVVQILPMPQLSTMPAEPSPAAIPATRSRTPDSEFSLPPATTRAAHS